MKVARRLRRDMTDAERKLWAALRNRQIENVKFRRQHPLGRYLLDFYAEDHRLVIELDGNQHTADGDAERTAWLVAQGCRVLRFWNHEVMKQFDDVMAAIHTALIDPASLPTGGHGAERLGRG